MYRSRQMRLSTYASAARKRTWHLAVLHLADGGLDLEATVSFTVIGISRSDRLFLRKAHGTWPFCILPTAALTSGPMQSSTFSTCVPSSSDRRGTTGVSLNLSSGPSFGRPCGSTAQGLETDDGWEACAGRVRERRFVQ